MDYRFKISGSSSPFRVQVFSGTSEINDIGIEYSGTCVVINNLKECSNYSLSISDGINTNINKSFDTCCLGAQVSASTTPVKTFGIVGIPIQPSGPTPNTVCLVESPKTFSIDPPLNANDCARIYVDVCLCDNGTDVLNEVNFYKSCNGGSFNCFCGYSSNCSDTSMILTDMGQNDALCYDLSSTYGGSGIGNNSGCASIKITDVCSLSGTFSGETDSTASGITTNINYCVTTTTTTTTQTPIELCFNPALTDCDQASRVWTLSSGICTSRPLQSGECVEICFTDCTLLCKNDYAGPIDAFGCWQDVYNSSFHGVVNSDLGSSIIGSSDDCCYTSIILTPENQDLIQINLGVGVNPLDMDKSVSARASVGFNGLDKQIGANFSWGGGTTLSLIKAGSNSSSGGGGTEEEPEGDIIDPQSDRLI